MRYAAPANVTREKGPHHGHVQMRDEELVRRTNQAFAEAAEGNLVPVIGQTFPLEEASAAHAAIETARCSARLCCRDADRQA